MYQTSNFIRSLVMSKCRSTLGCTLIPSVDVPWELDGVRCCLKFPHGAKSWMAPHSWEVKSFGSELSLCHVNTQLLRFSNALPNQSPLHLSYPCVRSSPSSCVSHTLFQTKSPLDLSYPCVRSSPSSCVSHTLFRTKVLWI